MNYCAIRTDDMLNGEGLRVVLFVSGCPHKDKCIGCHNPETWDINSGKPFTIHTLLTIIKEANKDYISGITISGGDPLHEDNVYDVLTVIETFRSVLPQKTIWLYTGFSWEELMNKNSNETDEVRQKIIKLCDVVCDGKFIQCLADVNFHWVGSINQRVIDVKQSLINSQIVLLK